MEGGGYKETAESCGMLADKAIEADVRRYLDANAADTPFGSGIDVLVEDGKVVLGGVVSAPSGLGSVVEKIGSIAGVGEVENNVIYVPVNKGV